MSFIPQSGWRLIYVDSEESAGEDGRGVNAFDGEPGTFWQTEWLNTQPPYPHEIQIDLGMTYTLESFSYLPRQDGNSRGRIKDYAFFASNLVSSWGSAVSTGTFADSAAEKTVVFDAPVVGRYIRLLALNGVSDQASASLAEINLVGAVFTGALPPVGAIASPTENLTIALGGTVFFSGSGTDPMDLELAYEWDFGGAGIGEMIVKDPGAVQFSTPGSYTVTFTVSNSAGLSDSDSRIITVLSGVQPPSGTIDSPVGDMTLFVGGSVFFSGNGNDPDGLSVTYLWSFGDSGISDAASATPGNVQFNHAGTYTVTFTVSNSAGLSVSDSRLITALNPSASAPLIPQDDWSLVYVDSEELERENGPAVNAFDGNAGSIWHTQWFSFLSPHPHEIQIDLGAIYALSGFRYLPRQDGGDTGRVGMSALYLSLDGVNWGHPVATAILLNSMEEKEVFFSARPARFVRLQAFNSTKGDVSTSAAELNFLGEPFDGNLPPSGIISTPATNLTILTGTWVDFSGSGTDPELDLPLTYHWDFGDPAIEDAESPNPAPVQFNHPGTYTVTLTVIDALGRPDATPATRVVKVVDNVGDGLIPLASWTLKYVDSEELVGGDGRGVNAFDGNPGTIWHTQWQSVQPPHPHDIQIDLGAVYTLDTLHYLPRQDGDTRGWIKDYAIYVSGNGFDWGNAVAMGSFANSAAQQTVLFPPKPGRFIRLLSLTEVADRPYASVAEINAEGVCDTPYVKLVRPLNGHVQGPAALTVDAAVCLNHDFYPGWGVRLSLHGGGGVIDEVTLLDSPYVHTFQGLSPAEYEVEAFIVDASGNAVSGTDTFDWALQVGIGGHFVAIGDSITHGFRDDILSDNQSQDGRNIEAGFTPILNDRLTAGRGYPHSVVNEGVGGIKSAGGLARLTDVIKRHPDGDYYLILYGTNDSLGSFPVPSGQGLNAGDPGYPGSFKDNMQRIIDTVVSAGKVPYLAKVPYTGSGVTRNTLIQLYNVAIDELVVDNGIGIEPPDFFSHFQANPGQLIDTVHPNGLGYQSMAHLWRDALIQ